MCDGAALVREWALVAAGLVWEAKPSEFCVLHRRPTKDANGRMPAGISANTLRVTLEPIGHAIACETCRDALRRRIQDVVYSWSAVPVRRILFNVHGFMAPLDVLPVNQATI